MSIFQIFGTAGATYVRRRPEEEYHQDCIVPTVKHGGGSLMVWGCMAANGVGEISVCEGRMNAPKYIDLLSENLEASFTKLCLSDHPDLIFQQDSAPCHTAKTVQKWFQENDVTVMKWPSQSPDLNPIEHLWHEIKKRVKKKALKNKEDLRRTLLEVWDDISPSVCENLVASMPKRVAAVVKNKGGPTKY